MITRASECIHWAVEASWVLIPLTWSPQTVSPCSDWVAVCLLFCLCTTISPCIHTCIACKLCRLWVNMVCFIYFITFDFFLVVFNASAGPKSPILHASLPHWLHKPLNEAESCSPQTMSPPLNMAPTLIHTPSWPQLVFHSPSPPTQPPPHQYRGQSLCYNTFLVPKNLKYVDWFNIGGYLWLWDPNEQIPAMVTVASRTATMMAAGVRDDYALVQGHGSA